MDFCTTSFDNSFKALLMMQGRMEQWATMSLKQTVARPEAAKARTAWTKTDRKGSEDYQEAVNDGFKKLEEFLAEPRERGHHS